MPAAFFIYGDRGFPVASIVGLKRSTDERCLVTVVDASARLVTLPVAASLSRTVALLNGGADSLPPCTE